MIRFQIVERDDVHLYRTLVTAMREGELHTLHLARRGRRVVHERYPGWINWAHSRGVIDCEVHSPRKIGSEWQLFSAVLGRLADKYASSIGGINVQFPAAQAAVRPRARKTRRRAS